MKMKLVVGSVLSKHALVKRNFAMVNCSHLHAVEAHKVVQFVVLHNSQEEQEEHDEGYKLAAVVQRRQRSCAHSLNLLIQPWLAGQLYSENFTACLQPSQTMSSALSPDNRLVIRTGCRCTQQGSLITS